MPQGLALYCFIAAGGATGACLRYFVTTSVDSLFGKHMPFGTLTVNVVGSFALALLYGFIERHDLSDSPYRALIGVGLLGAFTTFSTFSVETLTLLENGLWLKAAANVFLNVGACLIAGWLAIQLMKG
ncbi:MULTISPECIES: fluoride efflux transporter CrcB [Alteromonas]|uniref:Fluoride-specific ion channel FluC n=2 Tax=Alteromonas macleodii TaxID=28108 RepID=A0A1E7DDU2_ALTMA|nr:MULTISPECIES: fluoride efflux transporter CrcB [Alteromonas]MCG7639391.1 fluoride efflux transporter CrcB [Alteromonas sp. CNT1-28]MCG7642959.1 fluoride efflux transporter CrcB [Alteromonas sp. MmMcT2-2]MCG7644035.1 fluoride efflux transporter CrcB [Alteromonas sp. Cnat3-28]MCG7649954.1 fluoride efflux transporter CrcB [Alteromonas sp. MmMcT2-5]MCG7654129.1 fluoride efflux transporter CrcB [Alteromonas sp. Cnat2-8]MCG8494418.1 fluoride efflux transporter CrcB [Enterobacterales bacterium]M